MKTDKKIRMLLYESIACWYQLRWRSSDATIIIRIHEAYLATLQNVSATAPIVRHFEKQFEMTADLFNPGFCGSFSTDTFGFNRALIKQPRRSGDSFVEYWAKIPVVWFDTHETCRYCEGTKKQALSGGHCYGCRGSGKTRECDLTHTHEFQTSLVILLTLLSVPPEVDMPTNLFQALSVEMRAGEGRSGSGVWGEMSSNTVEYLRGLSVSKRDGLIYEVSEAVMIAYATMMGKLADPYAFHRRLDSRGMHFNCPGDATGIDCSFDGVHSQPYGAQFSPHNVDSPIQGLSLFVGIVKLSEIVQFWLRREIPEPKEK